MKKVYLSLLLLAATVMAGKAQIVLLESNFENFVLAPNSSLNGSGGSVPGKFSSANAEFSSYYSTAFGGFWGSGWAYSSVQNDDSAGYTNMYASYADGGNMGSANYAVGQDGSYIRITGVDKGKVVKGLFVTNGTYAGLSMKNGDGIAKKFGGISGNDPDYFVLTIRAFLNGVKSTDSVNFYLADFRPANNTLDYIQKDWAWVDLGALGAADSLFFVLSSSDVGQFGMNTPAFFCIDDLTTDNDISDFESLSTGSNHYWNKTITTLRSMHEDSLAWYPTAYSTSVYGDYWMSGFAISNMKDTTTAGYSNLYSAYPGIGYGNSANYAVSQNDTRIRLKNKISNTLLKGFYITNTTYAALSMKDGDGIAKKFGGITGNDPDYFVLTVKAFKNGTKKADSVNFYLADFRFADNSQDYIVKNWTWVDLSSLGNTDSIEFHLSSSDVGQFGMNTPAFFALDNLQQNLPGALDESNTTAFHIYPNPASTLLHIDIDPSMLREVSVSDLSGKKVLSTATATVDVSGLANGLYIIKVETSEGTGTQKFIKN